MKMPKTPPDLLDGIHGIDTPERLVQILQKVPGPTVDGKYLHWDNVARRTPPEGLTTVEWWIGLKLRRQSQYTAVPLRDKAGQPFRFLLVDPIPGLLHQLDLGANQRALLPRPSMRVHVPDPSEQRAMLEDWLIEESVSSSRLEGARTTEKEARDMLRVQRAPRNRDEQMIRNNYEAMRELEDLKGEPLTKNLVFELHRIATERTLDTPGAAGRFRHAHETVVVGADSGEVFHDPPSAGELDERMAALCEFGNGDGSGPFVHPIVRSMILHFWLAYDHPFVDGNGRTARALFYWSALRHGFDVFEFLSVSPIFQRAPVKYARAFLHAQTDDNDLTYFILHHCDAVRKAVENLNQTIRRRTDRLAEIERTSQGFVYLNGRQRDLVAHALRHPGHRYTIDSHMVWHKVVHQTARTDLLDLAGRGLLTAEKIRRRWYFTPAPDIAERLRQLS